MLLPSLLVVGLQLALGVWAQDEMAVDDVAVARQRIEELQKAYKIDWNNQPAKGGKPLDQNSDPQVSVYIERHVEKSFLNLGSADATFTLTQSTTVIKDVTEGSSLTASSSSGIQLSGGGRAVDLSISRSKTDSRTDSQYKSNGSYRTKMRSRQQTCRAGHACRFESWTYHVQITGRCRGEPCEMRVPLTGPDAKPLTAVIYIPRAMPAGGVAAAQESLRAELERKYCVDWSKPPMREAYQQQITWSRSVHRTAARLLNKGLKVTVRARRVAEPSQGSTGSDEAVLYAEESHTAIESTTKGWSVGAHVSSSFGLSAPLPLPGPLSKLGLSGGFSFSNSKSEDKSRQQSDGTWKSDGFSVRVACPAGQTCAFETWTFAAHLVGICEDTKNLRLQKRCQLDVPLFDRLGEPHSHFAIVSEAGLVPAANPGDAKDPGQDQPPPGDKKAPKALGAIGHLCVTDNFDYWSVEKGKYLNFTTEEFDDNFASPKPLNLEFCKDPFHRETPETGNKCYKNEIHAPPASGSKPDESKPDESKPEQKATQEDKGEQTSQAAKVNGKLVVDKWRRRWCPLDNGKYYNPDTDKYWVSEGTEGVADAAASKPQGIEECLKGAEGGADKQPATDRPAAKATGDVKTDQANRSWCVLDNGEWYGKTNNDYFVEDDEPGEKRPNEPKPQDLDKCRIPEAAQKPGGEGSSSGGGCKEASSVKVTFRLSEATTHGQAVKIVGNTDALGNWDTGKAVALDASEYRHPDKPVWKGVVELPAGQKIEYKYIKVEPEGRGLQWEADPNHSYEVPKSCEPTAEQVDSWHK